MRRVRSRRRRSSSAPTSSASARSSRATSTAAARSPNGSPSRSANACDGASSRRCRHGDRRSNACGSITRSVRPSSSWQATSAPSATAARWSTRSAIAICCTSRSVSRPGSASWGATARSSTRSSVRCFAWAAWQRRSTWPSITRSTRASPGSATPAGRAASIARRRQSLTSAVQMRARITWATTATSSTPAAAFPTSPGTRYCSICLPVCVYNHKEWARDFDGHATRLFPTVLMPEAPPAVDPPAGTPLHFYPHLKRP